MRETAEVFGEGGPSLRGMLHWPATESPAWGIVLCCPFGEERKSAARVMTLAARDFCREGFCVLRFDYRGTGESDGCIETATPWQWAGDIRSARRHLAARTGAAKVGLLGIRFGAALAAMTPTDGVPLPFLVAWAPLWSGRTCLDECVRHLAATRLAVDGSRGGSGRVWAERQEGVDMGGFILPPMSYREFEAAEIVQGGRAEVVVTLHFSHRAAMSDEHRTMCRRLTARGGAWRALDVPGRPFWVTASRYDPQPLVDRTMEALTECGVIVRKGNRN